MADKTITLTLTVKEEAALARTIAAVCGAIIDDKAGGIVAHGDEAIIGRINAALNAVR